MILARSEAIRLTLQTLGLTLVADSVAAPEVIAELLRRHAYLMCPCTPTALSDAVCAAVKHLAGTDFSSDVVSDMVDAMVEHGDLIEVRDDDSAAPRTVLYTLPPSFVRCSANRTLLTGVLSQGEVDLSDHVRAHLAYRGHIRRIVGEFTPALQDKLLLSGFFETPLAQWLDCPKPTEPDVLLGRYVQRLLPAAGVDTTQFEFLGPRKAGISYKQRWTQKLPDDGFYVARRSLRYGAYSWCFVKITGGRLAGLLDLPAERKSWRGRDEAWMLQAALNSVQWAPDVVRVTVAGESCRFHFFFPLPRPFVRYLEALGDPVPDAGSLMCYEVPICDRQGVEQFLKTNLWLNVRTESMMGPTI